MAKGLKLNVRKFWGLIPTLVEVTGEKLVGDLFARQLNRVKGLTIFAKKLHGIRRCMRVFNAPVSFLLSQ